MATTDKFSRQMQPSTLTFQTQSLPLRQSDFQNMKAVIQNSLHHNLVTIITINKLTLNFLCVCKNHNMVIVDTKQT